MNISLRRIAGTLCFTTVAVATACTQSVATPEPASPAPLAQETALNPATMPAPTPTAPPVPTQTPEPTATPTPKPTPTPDADGIIWYDPNPATITVEGSTIIFNGDIEDETYRHFLLAVDDKEDQITEIRINSGGGITDHGISIGKWIFDHQIDVIVDELCFSSCANYIFTAGKNKIIEKDAIVGWHGSEQQDPFIAAGLGMTMRELHADRYDRRQEFGGPLMPQESKAEYVESMLRYDKYEADDDEPNFLEMIGVNLYLMVYGFLPDQIDHYYSDETEFGGWTFSIEDMAKFGVNNVTYQGDGKYPSEKALENHPVAVYSVPTESVPPAVIPTAIPEPTPPPGSTATPTPEPEIEAQRWIEPPPAFIAVEGDTVIVDGYIDFIAYTRFLQAVRGKENQINTLKITSDDDDIRPATQIGMWVHDNEIDIIVDEACFSVCANYIFTAGRNKIIEDSALVGWYGSPQEDEYAFQATGLSIEERLRRDIESGFLGVDPALDESGRERYVKEIASYIRNDTALEREFIEATGIRDDALVYGFIGFGFDVDWMPAYFFNGWTFSIEDMAKLGIENVTYSSESTYPDRQKATDRHLEIFTVP